MFKRENLVLLEITLNHLRRQTQSSSMMLAYGYALKTAANSLAFH
jgi:hypothetical protein